MAPLLEEPQLALVVAPMVVVAPRAEMAEETPTMVVVEAMEVMEVKLGAATMEAPALFECRHHLFLAMEAPALLAMEAWVAELEVAAQDGQERLAWAGPQGTQPWAGVMDLEVAMLEMAMLGTAMDLITMAMEMEMVSWVAWEMEKIHKVVLEQPWAVHPGHQLQAPIILAPHLAAGHLRKTRCVRNGLFSILVRSIATCVMVTKMPAFQLGQDSAVPIQTTGGGLQLH